MRRRSDVASSDSDDDERLVSRIASGDRSAFALLVSRHGDRSLALAERLLGDRAEAEDAVQESFARLWTVADRFDPGRARFTIWFYRVVSNAALDRLRKRRRLLPLPDGWNAVDSGRDSEAGMMHDQLVARVQQAVASLPERQRLALVLCHYEGLSNKEAGDIMALGVKGVESLLVRARRHLRQRLSGEVEA